MKALDFLLKHGSAKEIEAEIQERRKFIQECVGWLYPSIMENEIERLHQRIDELGAD
jgi:hypothetical protein